MGNMIDELNKINVLITRRAKWTAGEGMWRHHPTPLMGYTERMVKYLVGRIISFLTKGPFSFCTAGFVNRGSVPFGGMLTNRSDGHILLCSVIRVIQPSRGWSAFRRRIISAGEAGHGNHDDNNYYIPSKKRMSISKHAYRKMQQCLTSTKEDKTVDETSVLQVQVLPTRMPWSRLYTQDKTNDLK